MNNVQKPIQLSVSLEHSQLILDALVDLPYRRVAGLVQSLVGQVNAEMVRRRAEAQATSPAEGDAAASGEATLQ